MANTHRSYLYSRVVLIFQSKVRIDVILKLPNESRTPTESSSASINSDPNFRLLSEIHYPFILDMRSGTHLSQDKECLVSLAALQQGQPELI